MDPQIAFTFLRSIEELMTYCGRQIYFEEASRHAKEPYLILYSLDSGRVGEVGVRFPLVQISCFHTDQFKVIELAELVVKRTDGYRGTLMGKVVTDSCHSERQRAMRNDDGTWMCPVEMRFSYIEEE